MSKPRLRRKHTKSRRGCHNCKLRRVKCDETRPHCMNCGRYGVICSYTPSNGHTLRLVQEMEVPCPVSADGTATFELDEACTNSLRWFQWAQTSATIMNVPQEEILRLACSHPFLMHIILSVSAMHCRHLSPSGSQNPTTFEVYHTSQCTQLLLQKTRQPLQQELRDPVWIAATLLGIVVFSSISTNTPEEAWPLNSDASDLEWVRMTRNKMALWALTDPLRYDSLLQGMLGEYSEMFQPVSTRGKEGVPDTIIRLCCLTHSSTADNNPYFTAVHTLLPLLGRSPEGLSRSSILAFTSQMAPSFSALLQAKDPVALVLLACWYDIARRVIWWTQDRATVELESIRQYILRNYRQLDGVLDILPKNDI
ncbi:hypothetical protein BDV59DRAFT_179211 [Aspergillus ambiguus]|uniref:Zn(II)2Cys6 transcription factor domain-containing protein n=1 Tax=Aspergillus ambiguus TaxID=176160 RepID=UPI003CCD30B5